MTDHLEVSFTINNKTVWAPKWEDRKHHIIDACIPQWRTSLQPQRMGETKLTDLTPYLGSDIYSLLLEKNDAQQL